MILRFRKSKKSAGLKLLMALGALVAIAFYFIESAKKDVEGFLLDHGYSEIEYVSFRVIPLKKINPIYFNFAGTILSTRVIGRVYFYNGDFRVKSDFCQTRYSKLREVLGLDCRQVMLSNEDVLKSGVSRKKLLRGIGKRIE